MGTALCAVGNMTGNILTSTNATEGSQANWSEANAGGSVQITGVSCPTADACVAVDNNGDVMTSTNATGAASAWSFENLLPFTPEGEPHNALFGASCASTSFCALVGRDGRIFTSGDPFGEPSRSLGRGQEHQAPLRPKTFLLFAERFNNVTLGHRHRTRARFRFFSPTRTKGFECKREHGHYRAVQLTTALLDRARIPRPARAGDRRDGIARSGCDPALLLPPPPDREAVESAPLRATGFPEPFVDEPGYPGY